MIVLSMQQARTFELLLNFVSMTNQGQQKKKALCGVRKALVPGSKKLCGGVGQ